MLQLKHLVTKINFGTDLSFSRKRIIALGVFGLILMVVLQIWTMNRLAVLGEKITQIEKSKAALVMENQMLENQVASKASLQYIKKVADNLGFNSETNSRLKTVLSQELAANH